MLIKCKLQRRYQVYRIARGCIPQLLTVGYVTKVFRREIGLYNPGGPK